MEIHQFTTALLYGDAVGNQVLLLRRLLREAGYTSEIFTQHIDKQYTGEAYDYQSFARSTDSKIIYHHAIGCDIADFAYTLPNQVILYYHNITPPESLQGFNKPLRQGLTRGRKQLAAFADRTFALAGSDYNRAEMLQVGYQQVDVLPYSVDLSRIDIDINTPDAEHTRMRLRDGKINWLFVGRMAPNKRQDNVLRAFHYYHTLVNSNSRLILIGSDQTAPAYGLAVQMLAKRLGIASAVEFVGRVGADNSLGAYYQSADVFVCFSEHEGFCVPLLECMHFDLPIVALARTAVPYTLGDSGITVSDYRFDIVAELVETIRSDGDFRQKMIAAQRKRLDAFTPNRINTQLKASIGRMLHP